jgi:hypothetical protein
MACRKKLKMNWNQLLFVLYKSVSFLFFQHELCEIEYRN